MKKTSLGCNYIRITSSNYFVRFIYRTFISISHSKAKICFVRIKNTMQKNSFNKKLFQDMFSIMLIRAEKLLL